jgi:hypothetical protein
MLAHELERFGRFCSFDWLGVLREGLRDFSAEAIGEASRLREEGPRWPGAAISVEPDDDRPASQGDLSWR